MFGGNRIGWQPSQKTHQAYEDGRILALPTKRIPVDLEKGPEAQTGDTEDRTRQRKYIDGDAAHHTTALQQAIKAGIPHSQLASYHPPISGPLRIRNNVEDPVEDFRLDRSRSDPGEHGTGLAEAHSEAAKEAGLPEFAGSVSQFTRTQNLLRASQRVTTTAKGNLFYPIRERDDRTKTKKYVLNVAALQAAALRYYQTMIVAYGAEMCNGSVDGEMPNVLHRYCDAVRDMDYMQEKARNGFDHDPFLLTTSKQMEREMMFDAGLITDEEMKTGLPPALDEKNPTLPGVGRTARLHATEARARTINILCALLGGLALIVPMVVMTLVPSRTSVLVVTCSFVLVFALVIALLSGLKPNEVLAVTAGYAAVLVVFVGAQSGSVRSSLAS